MNANGASVVVLRPNIEGGARFDRTPPARTPAKALRMRFGRFELDEGNARLLCDGRPVDLPPRPFEVLCALARRSGSLVTKSALLDEVWGHRFVSESVLKTVIGKLRTALQDDARNPRIIETVQRRGYRFIAAEGAAGADCATGSSIGQWQPRAPASEAAGITAESALREIREMLLLLVEQPHAGNGAAASLLDYFARLAPRAANEGG